MMNDIFRDLIVEGIIVVYLDDILIFTIFLHPEKYEFCKEQIEYLGLVISENEVFMDLVKIAGVREWPTSENRMDI